MFTDPIYVAYVMGALAALILAALFYPMVVDAWEWIVRRKLRRQIRKEHEAYVERRAAHMREVLR